jgi:hypothetical protein
VRLKTPDIRRLIRAGWPLSTFVGFLILEISVFGGVPHDTRNAWLFGAALVLISERVLSATRQARPESLTVIGLAVVGSAWGLQYEEVAYLGMSESLFDIGRSLIVAAGLVCVGLGFLYLAQAVFGWPRKGPPKALADVCRGSAIWGLLAGSLAAAFWNSAEYAFVVGALSVLMLWPLDWVLDRLVAKAPDATALGRVSGGTTTESVEATGNFVGRSVGQTFAVRNSGEGEVLICQADRMEVVGLAGSKMHARIIGRVVDGQVEFEVSDVGLPDPGAPVELATGGCKHQVVEQPHAWRCGSLAGSEYPVYLDLFEAITHHTLVVGTTGSRKTSFAVQLIREARTRIPELSVVIFDVTGQWSAQFDHVSKPFDANDAVCAGALTVVELDSEPNVEETTATMTSAIFDELMGSESDEPRVLVVLEEAHRLVPEHGGDKSLGTRQAIAQGRKYGLGFLCVTQRTTTVAKDMTALCNTLVALRSFDDTTRRVASSYATSDFARVLPGLKDGRALLAGRGLHAGTPLIVDVDTRKLCPRSGSGARQIVSARVDSMSLRGATEP